MGWRSFARWKYRSVMARIIDHPLSRSECSFWIVAPGTVMMMEGPIGFASCSSIPDRAEQSSDGRQDVVVHHRVLAEEAVATESIGLVGDPGQLGDVELVGVFEQVR